MEYWTTSDRPASEQFSYWREVICEAFCPLVADWTTTYREAQADQRRIESWVRAEALAETNCAEVAAWSQVTRHGKNELRRTDTEDVFVNTPIQGHFVIQQQGRRCVVGPGEFAMVDSTDHFSIDWIGDKQTREWQCVSFRVPRKQLAPLLSRPDEFAAVKHSANQGGIDRLVLSTMLSIWKEVDHLDKAGAEAADSAFTAVLAAAIGGKEEFRHSSQLTVDAALRESIDRWLATNLLRQTLTTALVAARFGISVRKLHKLYEGTGRSFGQTVMALRVDGCARDLATYPDRWSLTALAAHWGFADLSHLNRVFRRYKGCSPSQYREACRRKVIL